MPTPLPPLHALLAFEAVARCNSITRAATELCVTHSAVSHQLRQLQEWLGVTLLERKGRGVALTEIGHYYAQVIHSAFEAIRNETERLAWRGQRPVTISAMPIVATQWLIPKLQHFFQNHPNIAVHVVYAYPEQKIAVNTDLAILFGRNQAPGWQAEPLMSGTLIPVCHPSYLEKVGPIHTPKDLQRATLLHDEDQRMWRLWFAKTGLEYTYQQQNPGLYLEDSSLLLSAALSGQGVALCRQALATKEVEQGRLLQVLPYSLEDEEDYYLFVNKSAYSSDNIHRVHDWLRQAAADMEPGN